MNAQPIALRRPLVIFNPTAGSRRRRRLERFLSALRAGGAAPQLRETRKPGDAKAFACAAAAGGCDAVLVAGGDGTINEAINGLLESGAPLPLGLLPLGTANVLAIELGLPRHPTAAAKVVLCNRRLSICLGDADNRAFSLMAGIGFDAAVVANLDPGRKRWLRQGAYALETVVQAFRFGFPHYEVVTAEGARFRARSVIACKASRYGGSFTLAPQASLQRSAFTLVLFESAGPLAVLRFSLALLLGRMHRCRGVRMVETAGATIAGPGGEAVQGDGDLIATLPLRLALRPAALEILAP